jgi:hypothetical protein
MRNFGHNETVWLNLDDFAKSFPGDNERLRGDETKIK